MCTQEVAVGDGPGLGERPELVEPLARDVELQQARLHHVEQRRHSPPLLLRLIAAPPEARVRKTLTFDLYLFQQTAKP